MITIDTLFLDYENSLIKRTNSIGAYNFYGAEPGGANQQRAISCIRYAIENVLGWEIEEAINKFDEYMIHAMKLDRIIEFIKWPSEVKVGNSRYILSLLYPERVKLNQYILIEEVYKGVLNGTEQFPRECFTGPDGFYRFCACFQYLITTYKTFSSLQELYEFILSSDGNKFLYKYRLKVPADQLQIRLIDCIHTVTKDEENSLLYHSFYDFEIQYRKAKMKNQKKGQTD